MATYHVTIRREPHRKWGFIITDGNGSKLAGVKGCRSRVRAEHLARGKAERLIALDRRLGRRSHVATGMPDVCAAYAWRDLDGLWYVGDRDSAGTHRDGLSEAVARHLAGQANLRDRD